MTCATAAECFLQGDTLKTEMQKLELVCVCCRFRFYRFRRCSFSLQLMVVIVISTLSKSSWTGSSQRILRYSSPDSLGTNYHILSISFRTRVSPVDITFRSWRGRTYSDNERHSDTCITMSVFASTVVKQQSVYQTTWLHSYHWFVLSGIRIELQSVPRSPRQRRHVRVRFTSILDTSGGRW